MKRFAFWTGVAAAALLAACSADKADEADSAQGKAASAGAGAEAGAGAPETAAAEASATSAGEAVVFENNDKRGEYVREFAYNWPAQVSAIPQLAARFSSERDAALAEQREDFENAIREFGGQDCIGCINRAYAKEWAVVTDLPRFLSLSASTYMFTGGAHPNGTYDALMWDREAGKPLTGEDLFTSQAALQKVLGPRWCAGLRKERSKRLEQDYGEDETFPCPPIKELVVLPGSASKQAFDRIGLLAAPYVAGSYAEGSYEVTVPVTPAVIAAVKPEYRAYFAVAK
ncbi:MAG: PdaC/SigV domain-containing protein [Erythrobacter sp.]